jgi:hypothetical protein
LAFTQAQLSPDSKTVIVPAHKFEPFSIKANTEYALYVNMLSAGVLKIKESSRSIGNELNSDGIVRTNVGALLTEGPFPATLGSAKAAEFEGVLHYSKVTTCNDLLETTNVEVEFAVNSDPTNQVLSGLSQTVEDVVEDFMDSDPALFQYKSIDKLAIQQVASNFVGRSGMFALSVSGL